MPIFYRDIRTCMQPHMDQFFNSAYTIVHPFTLQTCAQFFSYFNQNEENFHKSITAFND